MQGPRDSSERTDTAGKEGSGAITYHIDRAARLVTVTYVGKVTLAALAASQDQARRDPDFDPTFALLLDYTKADASGIDTAAVKRLANNTPFAPPAPRAFVVADDVGYGLVRMFRAYSELAGRGDMVEVFRDRDEAIRWIASVMARRPK
jgi:hypothetical protein